MLSHMGSHSIAPATSHRISELPSHQRGAAVSASTTHVARPPRTRAAPHELPLTDTSCHLLSPLPVRTLIVPSYFQHRGQPMADSPRVRGSVGRDPGSPARIWWKGWGPLWACTCVWPWVGMQLGRFVPHHEPSPGAGALVLAPSALHTRRCPRSPCPVSHQSLISVRWTKRQQSPEGVPSGSLAIPRSHLPQM